MNSPFLNAPVHLTPTKSYYQSTFFKHHQQQSNRTPPTGSSSDYDNNSSSSTSSYSINRGSECRGKAMRFEDHVSSADSCFLNLWPLLVSSDHADQPLGARKSRTRDLEKKVTFSPSRSSDSIGNSSRQQQRVIDTPMHRQLQVHLRHHLVTDAAQSLSLEENAYATNVVV